MIAPALAVKHIQGDLLAQDVDALVNPWNRNFVPRWLLIPQGVSGQLKRRTGPQPWKDLAKAGTLAIGEAVVTDGGRDHRSLIHVAGINAWWRATATSVRASTSNAVNAAIGHGFRSIAMSLIGSGHGSMSPATSAELIDLALTAIPTHPAGPLLQVVVVHR